MMNFLKVMAHLNHQKKLDKSSKNFESEIKKLKEEIKSLKSKNKERSEVISEQKANIKVLKKYVKKEDLEKVNKEIELSNEDETVLDLICTVEKGIKTYKIKTETKPEILVHWLSWTTMLYSVIERNSDDLIEKKDIHTKGIPLYPKPLSQKSPISILLTRMDLILFDIYTCMMKNIYGRLDSTWVPFILEHKVNILASNPMQTQPKLDKSVNFITVFNEHLLQLKRQRVFNVIIRQFFNQVFYYASARLFNYLLKRRDLCTCGIGFQVKFAISYIEDWTMGLDSELKEIIAPCLDQFSLLKEAANVLVIDKSVFNDQEMTHKIFTHINVLQMKQLLELFSTDKFYQDPVPSAVIKKLDMLCKQVAEPLRLELDINKLV